MHNPGLSVRHKSLMKINTDSKLKDFLVILFVTSAIFMMIACGLAVIVGECDLLLFVQIFVYPLLVLAGVLFFRLTINIKSDGRFLWQAVLVALVIRVASVLVLYYLLMELQGHPFLEGYKDEFSYHTISSYFAQDPQAPLSDVQLFGLSDSYGLYPYVVGFIYRLFGADTLVARFFNAAIGAICVVPFYLFIRNLGMKQETARLAAAFYIFSANVILFNSVQLKDSLLLLLCFFLAYLGSLLMKSPDIFKVFLITMAYFCCSLLFFYMRAQFFFLFFAYFLIFAYMGFFYKTSLNFSRTLAFALIIAVIGFVVYTAYSQIFSSMGRLSGDNIEHQFLRYEKWQVSGLLGPLVPVITAMTGFFLPLPTFIKLSNPDPGFIYSVDIIKIPTYIEIFFTSVIALSVLPALLKAKNRGVSVLFFLAFIFYISLVVTGLVPYPRHKLFFIELCLIVMAYGIIEAEIQWKRVFLVCIAGTLFVFIYNLVRLLARG